MEVVSLFVSPREVFIVEDKRAVTFVGQLTKVVECKRDVVLQETVVDMSRPSLAHRRREVFGRFRP